MKLTEAGLEVLRLLEKAPRNTTKTTAHGYVAGSVAASLIRKGLARRSPRAFTDSGWTDGPTTVEITPEGREALKGATP